MPSCVDESIICSVRPVGVSANATFVVDKDKMHFSDLKVMILGPGLRPAPSQCSSGLHHPELRFQRRSLQPLPPDYCRLSR